MGKAILLSILLTITYSWEEIKRTTRRLIRVLQKNNNKLFGYRRVLDIDREISSLISIAIIPVALIYLVFDSEILLTRFVLVASGLTFISAPYLFSRAYRASESAWFIPELMCLARFSSRSPVFLQVTA